MGWFGNIFGSGIETPEEAMQRARRAQGQPGKPPPMPSAPKPRAKTDFRNASPRQPTPPPLPVTETAEDAYDETRTISATFTPSAFAEWIHAIDHRLVKGFSELQHQTLATKVGRLRVGDSVAMHYQLFHDGSPCGLRMIIHRTSAEVLGIRAVGVGGAMDVLLDECAQRAGMFGELEGSEESSPRDGRFRRDEDGQHWRALLPIEAGLIFDYPIEVVVEQGRPGMIGGGEIWQTPLLQEILPNLPGLCAVTERQILEFSGDHPPDRDGLLPPRIHLSCQISDESEWFIRILPRDGTRSNWRVDFHGSDCLSVHREA